MDLVEQLRNKIRGRPTDDVLGAIAKGVELELKRKYLCLTFQLTIRPKTVDVAAIYDWVGSRQKDQEFVTAFTISFTGDDCTLTVPLSMAEDFEDVGYFYQNNRSISTFQYADPNMFNQLYKAIAELPGLPK